jgi:hypothetical protein
VARRTALARAFRVVRVRDPSAPHGILRAGARGSARARRSLPPSALGPAGGSGRRGSAAPRPDVPVPADGRPPRGREAPGVLQSRRDRRRGDRRAVPSRSPGRPIRSHCFVLHVQGSGRLRLADGSMVGVGYAGSNGRPYSSLGRTLASRGLLPRARRHSPTSAATSRASRPRSATRSSRRTSATRSSA